MLALPVGTFASMVMHTSNDKIASPVNHVDIVRLSTKVNVDDVGKGLVLPDLVDSRFARLHIGNIYLVFPDGNPIRARDRI